MPENLFECCDNFHKLILFHIQYTGLASAVLILIFLI